MKSPMAKLLLSATILLASFTSHATNTICTVNTYSNPQGFGLGRIAAIATFDLSKASYSLLVKKGGAIVENVSYGDATYAGASAKYGDLTDAVLIHISRDQGATQGVNILMAALSNDQQMAKFEISSSSKSNDVFVNYMAKGLSIGCQDEVSR